MGWVVVRGNTNVKRGGQMSPFFMSYCVFKDTDFLISKFWTNAQKVCGTKVHFMCLNWKKSKFWTKNKGVFYRWEECLPLLIPQFYSYPPSQRTQIPSAQTRFAEKECPKKIIRQNLVVLYIYIIFVSRFFIVEGLLKWVFGGEHKT